MLTELITGIVLGISVAMPIGPGSVEIIKRGLSKGFLSALFTGVGCLSADLIYIALVYLGLASFVKITAIKIIMLLLGTVVLGYIGIKGLIKDNKLKLKKTKEKSSYVAGLAIAGSSPFTALFWITVFGSMLATFTSPIFILTGIIIGILSWFTVLSSLTVLGRRFFSEKFLKFITIIGSVVIIGFGIRFFVLVVLEILKLI